ncbi:MAG: hypothetical protein KKG47_12620 [Proteobacteria bacterium]|nr:hypothetical protein [Pseudomonadota bacterium]MBU1738696.1 hypothetical protein [Pseudomonadota bacterium]
MTMYSSTTSYFGRSHLFLTTLVMMLILFSWSMRPGLLKAQSAQFLVLYSNDVHGETEPCG